MATLLGGYAVLGTGSFSVDATTAKSLTSTAAGGSNLTAVEGTTRANRVIKFIVSASGNIRFSAGGATPTSSTYHTLLAGNILEVDSDPRAFKFISASGTVTVWVDYLGA